MRMKTRNPTLEEVNEYEIAVRAAEETSLRLQLVITSLRSSCNAPSFARLNTKFEWVSPDNEPLVAD